MNKKLLSLALIMALTLVVFVPAVKGASASSLGPGQMTYVIATIAGGPQTVDPAEAYDTASGELIFNVYDPLIMFKGTTGSDFVPWLADSYSVSPDGQTYTFHIRTGVHWQDPAYGLVTPEDVQYSIQRVMVRDFVGGPAWMFYFPIFGTYGADTGDALAQGQAIANAVTRDDVAGTVTIQFATGFAYLPFLGIMAQTWGSIMSKQWCIDNGDWPGTGLNDGTWVAYHAPAVSPFDDPTNIMMGSGPFEFNFLNPAVEWSILRNGGQASDPHPTTTFWGGWSTTRTNLVGLSGVTSRGYVDEIAEYFIGEFATRLAGFIGPSPIYDNIAVPRGSISSVWQVQGVHQQYPLATQAVDAMFLSYDVGMTSPFIGTPTGYGYFGENGITPDFFSDVHARKAIAYSFNWPNFIGTAYLGEAVQVGIPLPPQGYEPYYNGSSALMYQENIPAAIAEWQQAWGGQVWANGFRFSAVYNEGNIPRLTAAQIIKANVEAVNTKFHVDIVSVAWNAYGQVWHGGPGGRATGPFYIVGWQVDYPDPDDWTVPFISPTGGTFAYPQHLDMDPNAALLDDLILWGAHNATIAGRDANYQALWKLYHDNAYSLPMENAFGRRCVRDWVHGFYYNPIFPGVDGYPLWKENIKSSTAPFAGKSADWEDITEDGKVDIKDLATAAKAFGAYFIQPSLPPNPAGPPGTYSANWNSKADVNLVDPAHPDTSGRCDMKVDIKDLATIAKLFGFVADNWVAGP
jgi:peptide/nickel transport system substrate-binding protein